MFTESESIKILRHDISATKLSPPPSTTAFHTPNTLRHSTTSEAFTPTESLSSQEGMTVPEIATAIQRTGEQIRAIPLRPTTKSETLTRAKLDDLVFYQVRLPFSLAGYELNSHIAAVIRASNMEQWWRTLHRFRYRGQEAIAQAASVASQVHANPVNDAQTFTPTEWDMVTFSYHYLLIQSILPGRFRQDSGCFSKPNGRILSSKILAQRKEFLSQFNTEKTCSQHERVSIALAKILDNWRTLHQAHVWALILQSKVLNNLVAVAWEGAPAEERASPEMKKYIDTLQYVASLGAYAKQFPAEVAPRFNLLALASRFGQEPLYRPRYLSLCDADRTFRDLEVLRRHPDADGDLDNFLSYWEKHGEK